MSGGYNRLEIINMALDRVGARAILTDTDASEEARLAIRHYTFVLKRLMMRYPWNWATKRKTKSPLVATPENTAFSTQFQLDGDFMRINYLGLPGVTLPHDAPEIDFAIEQDILYTNISPIVLAYVSTEFMDKPHLMHAPFADCLAWGLSTSLGPKFLDKATAVGDLRSQAEMAYRDATYFDSTHGSPAMRGESSAYQARGSSNGFFSDYRLSNARINY